MLDEGTLRERFPEIPWDQPVEIVIHDPDAYGNPALISVAVEIANHWACRYCIAMHGVKAEEITSGRATGMVFNTRPEALNHIERVHHD